MSNQDDSPELIRADIRKLIQHITALLHQVRSEIKSSPEDVTAWITDQVDQADQWRAAVRNHDRFTTPIHAIKIVKPIKRINGDSHERR